MKNWPPTFACVSRPCYVVSIQQYFDPSFQVLKLIDSGWHTLDFWSQWDSSFINLDFLLVTKFATPRFITCSICSLLARCSVLLVDRKDIFKGLHSCCIFVACCRYIGCCQHSRTWLSNTDVCNKCLLDQWYRIMPAPLVVVEKFEMCSPGGHLWWRPASGQFPPECCC